MLNEPLGSLSCSGATTLANVFCLACPEPEGLRRRHQILRPPDRPNFHRPYRLAPRYVTYRFRIVSQGGWVGWLGSLVAAAIQAWATRQWVRGNALEFRNATGIALVVPLRLLIPKNMPTVSLGDRIAASAIPDVPGCQYIAPDHHFIHCHVCMELTFLSHSGLCTGALPQGAQGLQTLTNQGLRRRRPGRHLQHPQGP